MSMDKDKIKAEVLKAVNRTRDEEGPNIPEELMAGIRQIVSGSIDLTYDLAKNQMEEEIELDEFLIRKDERKKTTEQFDPDVRKEYVDEDVGIIMAKIFDSDEKLIGRKILEEVKEGLDKLFVARDIENGLIAINEKNWEEFWKEHLKKEMSEK